MSTNPKDAIGSRKVSLSKLPAVALLHGAAAMMNGAAKYGAYNWRGNAVIASIYVDACLRHLLAWQAGEECAEDSGVHHLGHALACCALLLDAQATGNLVDDRPKDGGAFARVLAQLNAATAASASVCATYAICGNVEHCQNCAHTKKLVTEQPCCECSHNFVGDDRANHPCLFQVRRKP